MTVTVNATATAVVVAGTAATISSTNLTVAAGATALLVWLQFGSYSVVTVPTAVTVNWDNAGSPQTMTLLGSSTYSTGSVMFQANLYGLLSPTIGNKTLKATWTTAVNVAIFSVAFAGTATDTTAPAQYSRYALQKVSTNTWEFG